MPTRKKTKRPGPSVEELSNAELAELIAESKQADSQKNLDMALYDACKKGDIAKMQTLITKGANVNWINPKDRRSLLYIACRGNFIKIVDLLIESGADVNVGDARGNTPLCIAMENNKHEIVDKLVKAGADTNKKCIMENIAHSELRRESRLDYFPEIGNDSPLFIAVKANNVKMVTTLIEGGANPNTEENPLFYACLLKNYFDIADILIKAGADVNKTDDIFKYFKFGLRLQPQYNNVSPLYIATYYCYAEIVKLLIAAHANPNDNNTPIFVAIKHNCIPALKSLIEGGANVNILSDHWKETPLTLAAGIYNPQMVQILIAAGADVNKPNKDGLTPTYIAAYFNDIEAVEHLISAGADLNKYSSNGETPLYISTRFKDTTMLESLIRAGADVNKELIGIGKTPIHVAIEYNRSKALEKLISAGADVNRTRIDTGESPLHIASKLSNYAIVEILLEAGADKTIADRNGKLPYQVATRIEIRNLLKIEIPRGPRGPELKWQGWTRGDASMLDGVFGDDATAKNFALCPVCMKYVIRKDACMYMTHNCADVRGGYYHHELYDKYKNSAGEINWCTICGRICKGHNHFELGSSKAEKPPIIHRGDPFGSSCEPAGGGGVKEKLLRFRRLREHARDLQAQVGQIGWWQAMDELCEEMWDAPLKQSNALNKMIAEKKFNIPNTNFPVSLPAIENNAPNLPFNGELPIVHPTETDAFTNALYIDDANIIQFRHKKPNGVWNRHEGPGQQISREAFVGWLKSQMEDPTAVKFGKCWQHKTAAQQAVLSDAEKALVCDAILHPEEVKAALDLTDPEQAKLAEGYRKAFNTAMDVRKLYRD